MLLQKVRFNNSVDIILIAITVSNALCSTKNSNLAFLNNFLKVTDESI